MPDYWSRPYPQKSLLTSERTEDRAWQQSQKHCQKILDAALTVVETAEVPTVPPVQAKPSEIEMLLLQALERQQSIDPNYLWTVVPFTTEILLSGGRYVVRAAAYSTFTCRYLVMDAYPGLYMEEFKVGNVSYVYGYGGSTPSSMFERPMPFFCGNDVQIGNQFQMHMSNRTVDSIPFCASMLGLRPKDLY